MKVYIIISAYWSEVPGHVKLIGTDHPTPSAEFDRLTRACQRDRTWHFGSSNCNYDKCTIYLYNVIENFLDQLFKVYLLKRTLHFWKNEWYFYMRTINPERVFFFLLNIIQNASKETLIFRSRICVFNFEGDIILHCAMWMTSQYLMHCTYWEKTLFATRHQLQRGVVWIQKW